MKPQFASFSTFWPVVYYGDGAISAVIWWSRLHDINIGWKSNATILNELMKKIFSVFRTICRFNAGQRTLLGLTKSFDDGRADVISVNVETGSKSIIQVKDIGAKKVQSKYSGVLPQKAIIGLWNALASCSRNPKILQSEADQLREKLNQRKFPASPKEIHDVRYEIKKQLEAEDGFPDRNSISQKVLQAFDLEVKKKVNKLLRNTRYNWKPLNFKTREHAAVYTLARIAPNYAEVHFVLQEFKKIGYIPETVLDYGSGSGAAFWAAFEQWGERVKSYQLIDSNEKISQFCMDILRGSGENNGHPFVHPNISFRKFLAPSLNNTFDVIIVHRLLAELSSEESRTELLIDLWKRTNKYLVLIDGSCKSGYNALMEARDYILMAGCELHREKTRQVLMEAEVLNEGAECILSDQQLSNYMRYNLIKNMLPPNTTLPTRLEPGYVFAPCPHDQGCPKNIEKAKDVCSFLTQWNVLRADERKQTFSTEIGSFSYVIMSKGTRPHQLSESRLLMLKHGGGHACCTVCMPFCGIQRFTISRSMGKIYKLVKNAKAGRVLPVEVKTVGSDSEFDVYEEAVNEYREEKGKKYDKNVMEKKILQ
ncbi:Methyltransferase-like protein 17 [Dirofilaria immitis]